MKKILVALLLFSGIVNAQNESTISDKKNEFRIDVLSAILSSKISVSYERFFSNDLVIVWSQKTKNSCLTNKKNTEGYRKKKKQKNFFKKRSRNSNFFENFYLEWLLADLLSS
jgi:hypothetical protein